jgi:hypothetical protein
MRDFWKIVEVIAGSRSWSKSEPPPLYALAFVQLFRTLQASLFCWKNLKIITDLRLVPFLSNALDTRQSRLLFWEKRYQHLCARRLRRIVCMPLSASWLRLHGASCVLRRPRRRPRFHTSHVPRSGSPNRGIVTPVVLRYVPKRLQIVIVCCAVRLKQFQYIVGLDVLSASLSMCLLAIRVRSVSRPPAIRPISTVAIPGWRVAS